MTKGLDALLLSVVVGLACLGAAPARAQTIKKESGRLQALIAELAGSDYVIDEAPADPRPYVDPTPALNDFRHMAATLAWGDAEIAARDAAKLDYEVVEFTDSATKSQYYVLREDLSRVKAIRGWGSYIVNPHSRIDALVEAPHPIADLHTPEIGGLVFEYAAAKGFLLAGANRTKADVPDLVDSVFHQVHTAWIGPTARVTAWQIHGFDRGKHDFPHGAEVVASTGSGEVDPEVRNLHALLENRGLTSYVFNDKAADSRLNQRLNRGVPGVTFSALAATKNEQGRLSRSLGGSFVHVELESSVRASAANRELAATVIADAMARGAEPRTDDGDDKRLLTSLETSAAAAEAAKSSESTSKAAGERMPADRVAAKSARRSDSRRRAALNDSSP